MAFEHLDEQLKMERIKEEKEFLIEFNKLCYPDKSDETIEKMADEEVKIWAKKYYDERKSHLVEVTMRNVDEMLDHLNAKVYEYDDTEEAKSIIGKIWEAILSEVDSFRVNLNKDEAGENGGAAFFRQALRMEKHGKYEEAVEIFSKCADSEKYGHMLNCYRQLGNKPGMMAMLYKMTEIYSGVMLTAKEKLLIGRMLETGFFGEVNLFKAFSLYADVAAGAYDNPVAELMLIKLIEDKGVLEKIVCSKCGKSLSDEHHIIFRDSLLWQDNAYCQICGKGLVSTKVYNVSTRTGKVIKTRYCISVG